MMTDFLERAQKEAKEAMQPAIWHRRPGLSIYVRIIGEHYSNGRKMFCVCKETCPNPAMGMLSVAADKTELL